MTNGLQARTGGSIQQKRQVWQNISLRITSSRDCLTAFLALESAEILAAQKPANLINIINKTRSCGRNMYQLWKIYGQEIMQGSGLAVREVIDRNDSVLLLIYAPEQLQSLLKGKSASIILKKAGYRDPANIEATLEELIHRVAGASFPHEIGVFLGYPLKDVVGFMGWTNLPFTCQGPWKIYGDPTESLRLADTFRHCRCRIASNLESCRDPGELLRLRAA